MKCTNCGLPLSPARTLQHCPRCGTPIASGQRPEVRPTPQYFETNREIGARGNGSAMPTPTMIQKPPASPPLQAAPPPRTPVQMPQPQPRWTPGPGNEPAVPSAPQMKQQPPHYTQPPLRPGQPGQTSVRRSGRVYPGFWVAGLCVLLGGVLLLFVYYMMLDLPNSAGNVASTQLTGTHPTINATPSATLPAPTRTQVAPTATPFPGQRYITNAQMASSINSASAKALQTTTTFKVNQTIYVVLQLHTGGQAGAVCISWYLNGARLFGYQLAVRPNSSATYSFATYGEGGSAYVQLYWASSTKCTDQVLAQQVNFTVIS
jgi:hypothetical protein